MTDETLIFFDIETTGIDPHKDHILEIYAAVFDKALDEPIDEFEAVLSPLPDDLSPFIQQMHGENGLLADVQARGRPPMQVLNELKTFFDKYPKALLVGRNVGTFDRAFVEHALPGVTSALHYRCIDLSSILTLFKFWPSECGPVLPNTRSNHRARGDVFGDVELLRAIVDWYGEL